MDLTTAITDFQRAKTVAGVQMRVVRKVLEMQELQGEAVVKLIERAAEAGDALAAAATGLGGRVDVGG